MASIAATPVAASSPAARARFIRDALPPGGLFADLHWRVATAPFLVSPAVAKEIETLGRVLVQFYRAANLLYRRSVSGKAPEWIARWLDQGKPAELIALQRDSAFKNDIPRVIRPDLLITDDGLAITELDSVPGGIGLTTWLYQSYESLFGSAWETPLPAEGASPQVNNSDPDHGSRPAGERSSPDGRTTHRFLGSAAGMRSGFSGIFGSAPRVHVVVSEESSTYRPEMEWLAPTMDAGRFHVHGPDFTGWQQGDAVYRFFELFDIANVPAALPAFQAARDKIIGLTPPPKPLFEEKMLFALLWNRHLRDYWRQELGAAFLDRLQKIVPYTWLMDPTPLPPHAALPELPLTDWRQLKDLSQRDRALIVKISGFSDQAWGARGVNLGSDLNSSDWSAAIERALTSWPDHPYILQRYHKPGIVASDWYDFEKDTAVHMDGRVRLCPYYFVTGDADLARPQLGGVLATVCPADKKIIHGMRDAVLAPVGQ